MLKAEYTRKINKSSLILTPEKDSGTERDSIEMFRYNDIPYFLKMEKQQKNIRMQFCYDITGKRSLEQLLEYKTLDYGMVQMILNSLDQACMQTEDYMITEHDILLEPEFIFADHSMDHMYYCYLPGNHVNICKQFKKFVEYLLQHLDHKDEQATQLTYGIYQHVVEEQISLHNVIIQNMNHLPVLQEIHNSSQLCDRKETENNGQFFIQQNKEYERKTDNREDKYKETTGGIPVLQHQASAESKWNVPDVQNTLDSEQVKQVKNIEQIQENAAIGKTDEISEVKKKETLRKQAAEKLKNMLRKKIFTDSSRYSEDTAVFEADEGETEAVCNHPTVCLIPDSDSIQNQFVYQGSDRSRDFHCMHGQMILGSDETDSDIYIPFPMISRVHARIEINAQGTYLEDMNSTNGTHVNGELLQYREKRMLQKGDIISLAGECYSFH